MIKWLRKKTWRMYYKEMYTSFAIQQHPAISYIMLCEIEFNGEKKFLEAGNKKYEDYFLRKICKVHAELIHESL